MPEADPPSRKDDDSPLLRDAVKVLTEEVRLQKDLMNLQNTHFQDCRQQLAAQGEELHRARQEAALHRTLLERQGEDLSHARQEAAVQEGVIERQAEDLRQAREELRRARQEADVQQGVIERQAEELRQARRQLNTRFWRYSRPLRRLVGLLGPKG